MKPTGTRYCIKTCSSENTQELETLLNEMSAQGWEIYTMHEVEGDDGFNFNCIFARDAQEEPEEDDDFDELFGYKTQMQKMIQLKMSLLSFVLIFREKSKTKGTESTKSAHLLMKLPNISARNLTKKCPFAWRSLQPLEKTSSA